MGKKYGSLHICVDGFDSDSESVVNKYCRAIEGIYSIDVKKVAERLGLDVRKGSFLFINTLINEKWTLRIRPKVVEHNGYMSVYDERLTFENIRKIAQDLSCRMLNPIFFSSVYDDDVYVFGLYEDKEMVFLNISGNCEEYGVDCINYNQENFERWLLRGEKSNEKLLEFEGEDLEDHIIRTLGFELDMNGL